ncbi:MAG TPA: ATP-binding cassette domain-containing protein, partial [Bradyrhizobium sp.]
MPPDAAPLMKATGIDAGYGTMQVLWGVDLDVRAGETVLLLGANGAGKTTFLKSLVGLIDARHGRIDLAGSDVTRMRSSDRMRLGMTYMSELAVFPDLSIEENIRVGAQALGHADPAARVDELYRIFPVLRDKRRAPASSLSGGQRKMLGIAKALAAEPRLLVMDEPSAGLSP